MTENRRNYFFWNKAEFEDSVKKLACFQCPYFDPGHDCKNPDPRGCALFRYLPDLVRIAQRLQSPDIDKFREAVEKEAHLHCEHPSPKDCALLDTLECGLDWLLPFVLQAVLKTDKDLERIAPPPRADEPRIGDSPVRPPRFSPKKYGGPPDF